MVKPSPLALSRVVVMLLATTGEAPLFAQQQPLSATLRVCVATPPCAGSACPESAVSRRDLLVSKINGTHGTPKLEARDAGFRPHTICTTESLRSCDYVALIEEFGSSRHTPLRPYEIQAAQAAPATARPPQPQDESSRLAEERQQEPLDEASLRFHVIRMRGCQQLDSKELKKLETSQQISKDSMEWLAAKAAERIRKVIEKDWKAATK